MVGLLLPQPNTTATDRDRGAGRRAQKYLNAAAAAEGRAALAAWHDLVVGRGALEEEMVHCSKKE